MEKVKPTIIESKGMSFEELIIAYEKQCNMWNELKEWLDEKSSEYMTKYRKTYNERDDEKSETYNEIFNKMQDIEKENDE